MKSKKEKISITLDPELKLELHRMAEEEQRSLSQFINIALTQWVQDAKKNIRMKR